MNLRYPLYALCAFILAAAPASAASISVDGSSCTLKDAITAAESDTATGGCAAGDGADTITLSADITLDATLPEIKSTITIDGAGKEISGDEKFSIFYVNGGDLTLHDLTISDAVTATHGGALYVLSGALKLDDVDVEDNSAGDLGGGLYALNSDVDIEYSEFTNNVTETSHGGAIYFASSGELNSLDILESVFKENDAVEDGGAVKVARGEVTIKKSSFVNNTADEGGALESSNAILAITNSTFSKNKAREGGGISSFASDTTLTHVTLAYNSASEQGGGLAIIGWTGSVKMRNTLITESLGGGDCHPGPNPDIFTEHTGNFIQDGSCPPPPPPTATPTPTIDPKATATHTPTATTTPTTDPNATATHTPDPNATASPTPTATSEASAQGAAQAELEAEAQHVPSDDGIPALQQVDAGISQQTSGSLPVHRLQWGSPAIDGGDPLYCLSDDQIDTSRPQYDNCDIGAYEYPKPPPTSTPAPATNTRPAPAATASPTITPTATDSADCVHIVQAGENLFRIAMLYDMTVQEVSSFNNLFRDDQLSVGQELVIPFDHCASPLPRKG